MKYPIFILLGFVFGIFIFLPINELTSYYEYQRDAGFTVWQFVNSQLLKAITFETPIKFFFYLIFGGIMGFVSIVLMSILSKRNQYILQLSKELDKNLPALLSRGEDDGLEFKSSFRYDYKLQKANKALENVIIKTLAGFMNAQGGSLLIGVDDTGNILGLEPDYQTLGRKDSDGFTQLMMSTVADRIGVPACRLLRILFHHHEGKEVCRVIVIPLILPIYIKEDNQTRFYIRTGSGTREMDIREAIAFIKTKWG